MVQQCSINKKFISFIDFDLTNKILYNLYIIM